MPRKSPRPAELKANLALFYYYFSFVSLFWPVFCFILFVVLSFYPNKRLQKFFVKNVIDKLSSKIHNSCNIQFCFYKMYEHLIYAKYVTLKS